MKELQLHYIDKLGEVEYSNLFPEYVLYIDFEKDFKRRELCPIRNKFKRHALETFEDGKIYLAVYDNEITQNNFNKYLNIVKSISSVFGRLKEDNIKGQSLKFRRLKHNLVNYNANILQEIYKLVPQEDLIKGGRNQANLIKTVLKNKPDIASYSFLRILKSSNLMKAEFDVYDMLNTKTPFLDFQKHSIHKVVVLTLNSFWLDLIEKGINIEISRCELEVDIDYKSISVALCHIFDNATKYTLPNSNMSIEFEEEGTYIAVHFKMRSLFIEDTEVNQIKQENFSGKWAVSLGLAGDGIGMNVTNQILKLNNGDFIISREKASSSQKINGIPYSHNKFTFLLQKNG